MENLLKELFNKYDCQVYMGTLNTYVEDGAFRPSFTADDSNQLLEIITILNREGYQFSVEFSLKNNKEEEGI